MKSVKEKRQRALEITRNPSGTQAKGGKIYVRASQGSWVHVGQALEVCMLFASRCYVRSIVQGVSVCESECL